MEAKSGTSDIQLVQTADRSNDAPAADQAPPGEVPGGAGGQAPMVKATAKKGSLPFHPVADMFPLMVGAPYESLKQDIQTNGLRVKIWTYQGMIIDGRKRDLACLELGIKPEFQEWDGHGSLVEFVISLNQKRRHL